MNGPGYVRWLDTLGRGDVGEAGGNNASLGRMRLLHGDPADAIVDVAQLQGADLVVPGSRGVGRLEGVLPGSVSQKVSAGVAAGCLTVH